MHASSSSPLVKGESKGDCIANEANSEFQHATTFRVYRFRKIPVLIISANHDNDIITKTKQMGAVGYIKKPVDINEVEKKISRLLKYNRQSSPSN